jgi:hypothetical protein
MSIIQFESSKNPSRSLDDADFNIGLHTCLPGGRDFSDFSMIFVIV